MTITNFTDLDIWKKSHALTIFVYQLTRNFPQEEKYALTDQLRRAVVSIESNIAEGFSRYGKPEKRQFYSIAKGSLTEVYCQMMVARDVGYVSTTDFKKISMMINEVGMMFTGILKSMRSW